MFAEVIGSIVQNAMAANPSAGTEYMGEDGLLALRSMRRACPAVRRGAEEIPARRDSSNAVPLHPGEVPPAEGGGRTPQGG